jgi:hypothetical protein
MPTADSGLVLSPWRRAYLVGGAPAVDRQRVAVIIQGRQTLLVERLSSRHPFVMAGHQRKIYQNDTINLGGGVAMKRPTPLSCSKTSLRSPHRTSEQQAFKACTAKPF